MNVREPKKKRRVKVKEQPPFPIIIGNKNAWTNYTAQLTELGSCIIDPNEIVAIHSMGFFGKGSLSRGFPSFGKPRYGAPPVVRNRQWVRREEWLKQFNELSMVPNNSKQTNLEEYEFIHSENEDKPNDKFLNISRKESTPDIIELDATDSPEKNEETNKEIDKKAETSDTDIESIKDDSLNIVSENVTEECIDNNDECIEDEEKEGPFCFEDFNFKKDDVYFINDDVNIQNELLVLPDSDSETENYLKEIEPKIKHESFPVQETLHLTFEETFFLLYGLGCLNLIDFDGNLLDVDSAWHFFCKADKNFVPKYVVYHYFRSKGWVVKPGLKYGGDFLLYKQGPPFYHASYIVLVDVVDGDTLLRNENKIMHKLTWSNLLGLERLSETAAKEILFAQVLWPSSAVETSNSFNVDILSEFSVREVLWRRWNPKHNRDAEEEDDDSY